MVYSPTQVRPYQSDFVFPIAQSFQASERMVTRKVGFSLSSLFGFLVVFLFWEEGPEPGENVTDKGQSLRLKA